MELLFAWRYFKSKKSTNAINIIAWISVLAIAVGTTALIVVLSVFNGFEDLVKTLYTDFYSDIKVAPAKGKFFVLDNNQLAAIKKVTGIKQLSFVVEEKAMLLNGDFQTIVSIKGVDEHFTATNNLNAHISHGKYDVGTTDKPMLVAGVGIENAVVADPGKQGLPLTLYLPDRSATSFSAENGMRSFNVDVSGAFTVQQEFDNKYAFTNLPFIQYMLDLKANEYSAIEMAVSNPDDLNKVKKNLQRTLGDNFIVRTRLEQNQSLFTVMQVEKWFIYGVLSLILLVAAFNMIGALTMLVMEKQKDITLLKAVGASDNLIQRIFLSEGFVLATVGGVIGMVLAYLICVIQLQFKLVKLQGGTFIIDYYPVKMSGWDFILVACTVFLVTIFAAWIPARKASVQAYSLKS
ncbi:lipoprotein-releasing system permease protein [Filimonas lacunae]|uniref:Lipoprotein-releasing system permease protein n=1 Tax=Filimonas lacunae TaxID=477680 RepID=A0A173MN00_9BACT|nr:FtsX-like permease family protein [Filimonas lacunae]BAV09023.1 lipoprotein releasing system transmembrane protein LolC [Filimonas lacunae]SIS65967.1 lipoprotein-releasing system permease protein [Filimonas lacunae]